MQCKNCFYWKRDFLWHKRNPVSKDERKMGECYHSPPEVMQTLIPAVIRLSGYGLLRSKQEEYQMRPITEECDFCAFFKQKKKRK